MKLFRTILIYKLCFLLGISLLAPANGFAQRRKAAPSKSKPAVAANKADREEPTQACDGWQGTITYLEKEIDESVKPNQNGFERWKVARVKEGSVVLNGTRKGKAKVKLENYKLKEEESSTKGCCYSTLAGCSKWSTLKQRHQIVTEYVAQGQDDDTGVRVYTEGGKYTINFDLPAARGKSTFKISGSVQGSCDPKNDDSSSDEKVDPDVSTPYTPVRAEGTIDLQNPNVLKGSMQPDAHTMIVWNLVRAEGDCDEGDLSVAGLKLEHQVFPDPNAWQEIGDNTIDGNQVKITASISNSSKKSKSGTLVIKETMSGEVLGTQPVSIAGQGSKEVEIVWDTNGFAWTDARAKMPNRRIEAVLTNGSSADAEVKVYPKPVILVHGLWSNAAAWNDYPGYLAELHSFAWKAFAVGADPKHGKMNTGESLGNYEPTNSIFQNAQELGKQIKFAQETENAWRVDVVAHSMGGLISRFYIHHFMKMAPDGTPTINRLVMLGTPNQGSPWADIMFKEFKENGHHVEALRELKTDVCRTFNSQITNRKGVKFSIVYTDAVPLTGDTTEAGDGVVSKSSAIWQISDISHSDSLLHTSLTGKEDFLRYVYPRLAVGPKSAKQRASLLESPPLQESYAWQRIGENWLASNDPSSLGFLNNVPESTKFLQTGNGKSVTLKPNQTVELEIAATKAKRGGISFAAPSNVSATLLGANGEILGESPAGVPESNGYFRYILVDKPINAETWKLKLENRDEREVRIFYAAVFDTNPLALEFVEIQKQADGSVKVQTKLTNGSSTVKDAIVILKINNQPKETALFDDGKHGDGAAGDGIYGATTEKLASGEHFIEAAANAGNLQVSANVVLTIDKPY